MDVAKLANHVKSDSLFFLFISLLIVCDCAILIGWAIIFDTRPEFGYLCNHLRLDKLFLNNDKTFSLEIELPFEFTNPFLIHPSTLCCCQLNLGVTQGSPLMLLSIIHLSSEDIGELGC